MSDSRREARPRGSTDDPPLPGRSPAVAGLFYPEGPAELATLVDDLLDESAVVAPAPPEVAAAPIAGVLVPHAGFVYSGLVAAAAWGLLRSPLGPMDPTVVLLGTNHGAGWLTGVGAWDGGPWWTPLGEVGIDGELTREVIELGAPFDADARCHLGEHSLEVQLPFVQRVAPGARVVPLSIGTGIGDRAVRAGEQLGRLLAARRVGGAPILLAISSDMAHYPPAGVAERVTATLLPYVLALDAVGLAEAEASVRWSERHTSCGMCGIEPTVLGLAALRAMGVHRGVPLLSATSADAGGDPGRTVGYLAVAFPAA